MVSDLDLHRDPGLLRRYRSVVINGHSEYWSAPAFEGLDAYLTCARTLGKRPFDVQLMGAAAE
mgnify:CR=1 FL=1